MIRLIERPNELDWLGVKQRALVTMGKEIKTYPTAEWMHSILKARHSPIRYLRFSFYMEIPYWVSVHLSRHVHAQPFIQSQRNDRQESYDRTKAPQDQTVKMIWDLNAEELMTVANKRLCKKASKETRDVVTQMCDLVERECPEFKGLLVPNCKYNRCHEMHPCAKDVMCE